MHVYRGHAAGTKSQPTQTIKHRSGNTSQGLVAAINYCFVHMRTAVAGVCIGRVLLGQLQIAHIHSQMQPLHVPGTWSCSQIQFHAYERKCNRHFYYGAHSRDKTYLRTHSRNCSYCVSQGHVPTRCRIVWVLRATRFHTYVLSLQHVPPNFIWSPFMRHVAATNVAKRTIFIVWTARERSSAALLQI